MIIAGIVSYVLGSLPTAFLIGKLFCGIDIRKHGSGNVGATNVFRTIGKAWGTVVLLIDMVKGFLPTFLIAKLLFDPSSPIGMLGFQIALGLCAIVGHVWPVWLRFKGGKGVATSCGVFLGIYPLAVTGALVIWVGTALALRYVSLASLVAAVSFPVWLYACYRKTEGWEIGVAVSLALLVFIFYTHRANLERLARGTEHRMGEKRN